MVNIIQYDINCHIFQYHDNITLDICYITKVCVIKTLLTTKYIIIPVNMRQLYHKSALAAFKDYSSSLLERREEIFSIFNIRLIIYRRTML